MEPRVDGSWRTTFKRELPLRREEVAAETSASLSTSFWFSTPSGWRRSSVVFGFGAAETTEVVEAAVANALLSEGALAFTKEANVEPVVAALQALAVLAEAEGLVVVAGGAEEFGRVVERC